MKDEREKDEHEVVTAEEAARAMASFFLNLLLLFLVLFVLCVAALNSNITELASRDRAQHEHVIEIHE